MTSVGQLNRMHQFRDKAGAARERASAGLLFYPVLMAADVLAYRAHEVPVGEDQREHIELMRDVAENFNKRFGETLVVPEGNIPTVGARVRDLKEPDEEDVDDRRHARRARSTSTRSPRASSRSSSARRPTPGARSCAPTTSPGISNLIEILAVVRGTAPAAIEHEFAGKGYGDFKTAVGEEVADVAGARRASATWSCARTPRRSRRSSRPGAEKARAIAAPVVADVREAMGVGKPVRSAT